MKYAWIAKNTAAWPITLMRELLGVSASGFFEHRGRTKAPMQGKPSSVRICCEALLGQCADKEPVGQPEGRQAVWQAIRHATPSNGRSDRLADVLQPPPASLNAGLRQPHAIRGTLARGPVKTSRVIGWLWTTSNEGKVTQQQHGRCANSREANFKLRHSPFRGCIAGRSFETY